LAKKLSGIAGRPRAFDEDAVVHDAMLTFWRHGFDGTTAGLLASATGLSASSLYNTFDSKQGLYLRALDHYNQILSDRLVSLTKGREGIADIDKFLRQLRQSKEGRSAIPGCLMANTLGEGGAGDAAVAMRTALYEQRIHTAFRAALDRAVDLGEIDASAPEPMARVFTASLIGILVAGRNKLPGIDQKFTGSLMALLKRWSPQTG
jgi:TetR/AcrR family transcriptional regulator, transcriptional repressor for nem operon